MIKKINSISIRKFIEISEKIKDDTSLQDRMEVIQIVSGCSMDEIRLIPIEILTNIWNEFVHNCFDLGDGAVDNIVTIEGKAYGLINVKNLTVGEMADIDVLKNHPQMNFNLHKIMAILYRPLISKLPFKVEPYTNEGFEDRAELFAEKMPVKVALNSAVFFLNTLVNLNAIIKDSSEKAPTNPTNNKATKGMITKLREVGIRLFISLQKMTFYNLKKSRK